MVVAGEALLPSLAPGRSVEAPCRPAHCAAAPQPPLVASARRILALAKLLNLAECNANCNRSRNCFSPWMMAARDCCPCHDACMTPGARKQVTSGQVEIIKSASLKVSTGTQTAPVTVLEGTRRSQLGPPATMRCALREAPCPSGCAADSEGLQPCLLECQLTAHPCSCLTHVMLFVALICSSLCVASEAQNCLTPCCIVPLSIHKSGIQSDGASLAREVNEAKITHRSGRVGVICMQGCVFTCLQFPASHTQSWERIPAG